MSVSPTSATVQTSGTRQFTATVTGTTNTAVTWRVNGVLGGSATTGTISTTGLYTAPATAPSSAVTVTARSVADSTKSASATVSVTAPAPALAVSISPTSATVQASQTQQFAATVTGTTNTAVTWLVNGVAGGNSATGTISATGLYTAPATAPSGAVTVTASSAADSTKSASATVNVTAPAPTVAVSVSPTSATVQASQTQQFAATVTGTTNTAVTWLVNGVQGGNATTGTVSASGLYTAPSSVPSPSSVTVMARSSADSTKSASAAVTITAPPQPVAVIISPTAASVSAGQTKQFSATVTGASDATVTWQVNGVTGGNGTVGTISTSGLYTAPQVTSSTTVTVTARSYYDSTKYANSSVTIAPTTSSTGRDWYVYSSGQDTSSCGTAGSPCATINYVNSKVAPGDTVHVSGSFTLNSNTCINTTTSGTAGKPITYKADPSAAINGNGACFYVWHNLADYINIYGFDFTGVQTVTTPDPTTVVILSEGGGGNIDVAYNTIHDLPSGFGAAVDIAPWGSGGYTGAPCSVHDNIFHDLGYNSGVEHGNYAMYIDCGTNSYVYNNLIYNEGSIGIHCWHSANQIHIYNNTIVNAQFIGIIVGTGDSGAVANAYFDVSNNIVVNSKYGILAEAYSPGSISTSSLFRNNLVYNNQIDWSYNGNSAGTMQSSGFAVTGTVVADPKFVSPSTGNYRLSSGSPALGKGLNVGITHDLDGNPRPSATGIDIGAY